MLDRLVVVDDEIRDRLLSGVSAVKMLRLPEASTAMMNLFLEQVSQTFSKHFIIMQVDGAGWHRANELVIPENIRLIPQPAYSPELNPVEHIWDKLREKYFYNRIFPSLEALIDVLCQGLCMTLRIMLSACVL